MSMYILLLCIHLHRFVLDSGGANGHNGGGPNCQASEPVALLKDPPGNRYLVFNGINYLHPGRLTWNIQITHLERKMIFQTSMIMFHVNLPGCTN